MVPQSSHCNEKTQVLICVSLIRQSGGSLHNKLKGWLIKMILSDHVKHNLPPIFDTS